MKKIAILCLFLGFLANSVYATQQEAQKDLAAFAPVTWFLSNEKEVIDIQSGSASPVLVLISVGTYPNQSPSKGDNTGVIVKNCDNVVHIGSGSSAICTLSPGQTISMIVANSSMGAQGTYQIR